MPKRIDLTGKTFGDWTVIGYIGKSTWECINRITKETKNISSYDLRTKYLSGLKEYKPKCVDNIAGQKFNEWTAIKYIGGTNGKWLCKCSCGNTGEISGHDLKNNKSKNCGSYIHRTEDLTGQKINEWTVLKYEGNLRWLCRCSCGKEQSVLTRNLKNASSKSCGHDRNYHIIHKDITGNTYGNLTVKGYTGKDNMWHCVCKCGKEVDVLRDSLVSGKTKSCGCLKENMRKNTLYEKYGDTNTTRVNHPREDWQIKTLESKEALENFIDSLDKSVTAYELSELLDVHNTTVLKALRKFDLIEKVREVHSGTSAMEIELLDILDKLNIKYINRDKDTIKGTELDIYIPEKKIAIEFNGNYWHSSIFKKSTYHQEKTIKCIQNGIHLIHIFEYEWLDLDMRDKIISYISSNLCETTVIYGRKTHISHIDNETAKEFLNKYHLQGYTPSTINLACINNDAIIGVMTFGTPRFDNDAQYELIRLCWKDGISVIGGTEKLFKHFLSEYKPDNIISYCDLTKFKGDVYLKLGFSTDRKLLTKPNYVWVKPYYNDVLTRYQTQKQKLISAGLGYEYETEDEIMSNLGYLKIYNSGNLKFIYNKQ